MQEKTHKIKKKFNWVTHERLIKSSTRLGEFSGALGQTPTFITAV